MRKLTCILIITLAILTTPALAQEHGFFFGTDLAGRSVNGSGEYSTTIYPITYETPVEGPTPFTFGGEFNITDQTGYYLDSKNFFGISPVLGYRFGSAFSATVSFDYLMTQEGSRPYWATRGRVGGAPLSGPTEFSSYSQRTLQVTGQFYPGFWQLFMIGGIEYNFLQLKLDSYTVYGGYLEPPQYEPQQYKSSETVFGWVVGLGIERPLKPQVTIVGTTTFSFSKYEGDGLYYGENKDTFELDVGGLSAHLGVRYYVR